MLVVPVIISPSVSNTAGSTIKAAYTDWSWLNASKKMRSGWTVMIGSSNSEPATHASFDQIASPRARSAIRRLKPCCRTTP